MNRYHFEMLAPTDYAFLVQETPELHMIVVGVTVFDAGPLRLPNGAVDFQALKQSMGDVLHQIPRYRQKLMWRTRRKRSPYLRQMVEQVDESLPPVWVDDPHFNLDYHMRHTALPKPGGDAQLKTLVGRIASQPLDSSRPLWETWVVEGLRGGRFATVSKLHHCMIDGESGADLSQLMLSTKPDVVMPESTPYRPRPAPSQKELSREMTKEQFSAPFKLAQNFQQLRKETDDLSEAIVRRVKGIRETFEESAGGERTATPINGKNGPHRAVDWLTMPLEDLKAMRQALDCSVNDVVLTIVTGTFREYLLATDFDLENQPFRVNVPVSIWGERKKGEVGNQIMNWMITLPLAETDPRSQLEEINSVTSELKKSNRALGVKTLESFLRYTPGLVAVGARNAAGPANSLVTNVPGPQMALYQMGAEMLENYAVVPLLEGMGLGIGVMSYNGTMFWGVTVDPDIVEDLDVFMAALGKSIKSVAKVAGLKQKANPTRRRAAAPKKKTATRKKAAAAKKSKTPAPRRKAAGRKAKTKGRK